VFGGGESGLIGLVLIATDPTSDWLGRASGAVVLAFVVVGFLNGWIVTGREAKAVREERDRALDLVYKQAEVAQRALDVTERTLANGG
jgi:hypothetical protein